MDRLKLPLCHLLNASVCERCPQIIAKIGERGDEIIGHGYTNSERQSDMDERAEAAMIRDTTANSGQTSWASSFRMDGPLDRRNADNSRPSERGGL